MKQTRIIMGMPITVEIRDQNGSPDLLEKVFGYFTQVDETFSTYKEQSEISRINRGEISLDEFSAEMKEVFEKSAETKKLTGGFFDIVNPSGTYDPSGLVKGWAIQNAANLLRESGAGYFFIEAGGDIQAVTPQNEDMRWIVGVRNPFNQTEVVKVLRIRNEGVATSGSYIRGAHIYNPHDSKKELQEIVSITVIGPNIYEADRFATAAFAMGREGVSFIDRQKGLEAYQIDKSGNALMTPGFAKYIMENENA